MSYSNIYCILTTINEPDERVSDWKKITQNETIVIGDKKTPSPWNHPSCSFISMVDQLNSEFTIANTSSPKSLHEKELRLFVCN